MPPPTIEQGTLVLQAYLATPVSNTLPTAGTLKARESLSLFLEGTLQAQQSSASGSTGGYWTPNYWTGGDWVGGYWPGLSQSGGGGLLLGGVLSLPPTSGEGLGSPGGYWPQGYWPKGFWSQGYWPGIGGAGIFLAAVLRLAPTDGLVLNATLQAEETKNLFLRAVLGVPPPSSGAPESFEFGPFFTRVDPWGRSKSVALVVIDIYPVGTAPNTIRVGQGYYRGVTDTTGKTTISLPWRPGDPSWAWRATYPAGAYDPNYPTQNHTIYGLFPYVRGSF